MKKFNSSIKKYKSYMLYASKATLKSEVANSYLNWLWWILDPFLFMLVYTFVAQIVFGKGEPFFPLFVFVGLNIWNFFNKSVIQSLKIIKANKGMLTKIYIPKYILILIQMLVNLFKMGVAFSIVLVMIPIYRVPITWMIFEILPLFLVLMLFTFGCCCIALHFGVFFNDLTNIVTVLLKLVFYMSGIFYSIPKRVPNPYNQFLLNINPLANIIDGARRCMLYQSHLNYISLGIWLVVSVLLSIIGVSLINKYESSYVKVI